ncbi:52 kDa repressor of the inhibitor of the protein kinase-like [Aphis craccivora]|uniref:52 kDa repressor of the inhibitor of the protein kinase-like n=1 Tax=Aphis craccivora TaxID=307492 RepID=A0A6G0W1E0_APHCR|nr:52 kDa repressor of the inhibitor of the protein kinase-like [Aphis craccivora]
MFSLILNLENHFKQNNVVLLLIEILLPKLALNENVSKLKNQILFYEDRVSEKVVVKSEFLLWCKNWVNVEKKPTEIIDILDACDNEFYPNIHFLLNILATLPVFTTTVEFSFSTLKRLKTLLRNKTGNECLMGLALLSVHWEVSISTDEVLNIMGQKGRKLIL